MKISVQINLDSKRGVHHFSYTYFYKKLRIWASTERFLKLSDLSTQFLVSLPIICSITVFMFTSCPLMNISEQGFLEPLQHLDVTTLVFTCFLYQSTCDILRCPNVGKASKNLVFKCSWGHRKVKTITRISFIKTNSFLGYTVFPSTVS